MYVEAVGLKTYDIYLGLASARTRKATLNDYDRDDCSFLTLRGPGFTLCSPLSKSFDWESIEEAILAGFLIGLCQSTFCFEPPS
jgi:hypothetical protein